MANLGTHFKPNEDSKDITSSHVFKGENYRITVFTERLIRFEYSKDGVFLDDLTNFAVNRNFPKVDIDHEEDNKFLMIGSKYFLLQYTKEKPFRGPSFAPDSNLRVRLNDTDKLWYPSHPEARNYKSASVSLDDLKNVKKEKGLYSTDGFVTIDDSKALIISGDGHVSKRVDGNTDFYLFIYKRDFGFCLNDYFTLTGFPVLLPKYALGIWWNRDRIYSDRESSLLINLFKKNNIPLSVFLLSEFWHVKDESNYNLHKSGFTFNPKLFPNPTEFVSLMHDNNVKVGINIDPAEGITKIDPVYRFLANELETVDGNPIPFNIFDRNFINNFLKEAIDPLINLDIDFFWVDYKDDLKKLEALNYYLFNNYNKLNKRPMLLSRNALVASHRYPVLYSGETIVDWKTLNYLPSFNNDSSNIGLSWWSHAVGGFKDGVEDNELYLKYIQFSCFSPIFRFSAKRGPYYKREPWLWDANTYTIAKKYCQLRYKIMPYLYSENYKYHKTGLPLVQPLYYTNPEVIDEPNYINEYKFGSSFLIAPITKPKNQIINRSIENIFLPDGTWYDFNNGKKYNGNKKYITFYKEEDYPVFVRAGAIIPMTVLDEDNLNDLSNPKVLEVDIFPGQNNIYKMYEDDGNTNAYKDGKYFITAFEYKYEVNNYTVTINPIEGTSEVVPRVRDYLIKFRNTKMASEITATMNGNLLNLESYEEDNNLIVKLSDVDTSRKVILNCKGNDIEIKAVRIMNEDINSIITDLKITTHLKERIADIIFGDLNINKKRIMINKLKREGLNPKFATIFLKLLEYSAEI